MNSNSYFFYPEEHEGREGIIIKMNSSNFVSFELFGVSKPKYCKEIFTRPATFGSTKNSAGSKIVKMLEL